MLYPSPALAQDTTAPTQAFRYTSSYFTLRHSRSSQAFIRLDLKKGSLQVLPVDLPHQGQVLLRVRPGPEIDAGTADAQQGALAHYVQGGMLPVLHSSKSRALPLSLLRRPSSVARGRLSHVG